MAGWSWLLAAVQVAPLARAAKWSWEKQSPFSTLPSARRHLLHLCHLQCWRISRSSSGSGRNSPCKAGSSGARSGGRGTSQSSLPRWCAWTPPTRCASSARRPQWETARSLPASWSCRGTLNYAQNIRVRLKQSKSMQTYLPPPLIVKVPSLATLPLTEFSIGTCDRMRRTSSWMMYPSWSKSYLCPNAIRVKND